VSKNGLFLVIEGTDGSGKGTQAKLLAQRLRSEGYDVAEFDFPRYDRQSSHFITEYLNGVYGTSEQVGPYTGSLFFALDRYEAAPEIRQALAEGKIVLANRFTGSNMAHQGTKFDNTEQRRGYFIWLDNLEYEMLKIPRPDKSFVLRVPAEIAQKLVDKKGERTYTDKKRDIHEADLDHLKRSVEVYDDLTQLFPKDFQRIDCVRGGKLLDIETVADIVYKTVQPHLPPKPAKSKKSEAAKPVQQPNPYVKKINDQWQITPAGRSFLNQAVTSIDSNVYSFSDKLSTLTIAAAMARLSRRGDDMRITILDEFATSAGKDADLLKRVITAFGDDSVQQLVGLHVVVEGASNLLTKQLEWGRLAAYLEQSTRYIYFDQKDADGRYKFFTPKNLDAKSRTLYEDSMTKIFDLYSDMVHKLTDYIQQNSSVPKEEQDGAWRAATRAQACDAIRPVLPVATKATVGIFASGQALESLIMHLMASESLEARDTGQQILEESRKVIPTFLERADKPDRGGATVAYMANTKNSVKQAVKNNLTESYSNDMDPVRLANVWPRNELDLVPHMVYEHSNLSLAEITAQVERWPYKKKTEVFEAYMGERLNRRHKPGRAVEMAHYSFDLVCDYGIFRDLQRHRMVDDLEWQPLTPRFGYEVPELVEEAGLTDTFEQCFDISTELYSQLQAQGYDYEAQYATLLGHRMRWKVTINAREAFHFFELRTSPQGHPGYRKLAQQMYEKVCEAHPLLGSAMIFVNQGEDPELTRLAAERATQYKLEQLDKNK
jgi:thymidylate kinase/thymidylate synthase ThyX